MAIPGQVRVVFSGRDMNTFTGVGYDKRILGERMPMTDQQNLTRE